MTAQPTITRILVVDDSAVVRRILAGIIDGDEFLELAGTAATGGTALRMARELRPDVLILDVEMPGMSGLEVLHALRREQPDLPVIMFSGYTERGANTTLEALAAGATDFVLKPSPADSLTTAVTHVHDHLIGKIRALFGHPLRMPRNAPPAPIARLPRSGRLHAVVIGCSTGGPNALATLLAALPGDLPVPVLIVQHMPPLFTQTLAKRLDGSSALTVREGRHGIIPRPGEAWLAPGDVHMRVRCLSGAVRLELDTRPPVNSCRPSVDCLFQSAAEAMGPVLGVVLTGMGHDGLTGCRSVRTAGGRVLVQDAATSVIWGMPGAIATEGLADGILPLDRIAATIVETLGIRPLHPSRSLAGGK